MHVKDVYIVLYGSKFGWKYQTSIIQKLYKDKDECIHYAKQAAKPWGSDVYIEQKDGSFKLLTEPPEKTRRPKK